MQASEGRAYHFLSLFFHGLLTYLSLENYGISGLECFTSGTWIIIEYLVCMEIYQDETPWTVPEVRWWYQGI